MVAPTQTPGPNRIERMAEITMKIIGTYQRNDMVKWSTFNLGNQRRNPTSSRSLKLRDPAFHPPKLSVTVLLLL
jgi:hypothetical protein